MSMISDRVASERVTDFLRKGKAMPADMDHETSLAIERGDTDEIEAQLCRAIHTDCHATVSNIRQEPGFIPWDEMFHHISDGEKSLKFARGSGAGSLRFLHSEARAYALLCTENALLDEFDEYKNSSVLGNLVCTDRDFRLVYALFRWCQEGALQDPAGFSDLVKEYESLSQVRNVRFSTFQQMSAGKQKLGVDLDSPCTKQDKELTDKAMRTMFNLMRCGKIDEAVKLVSDIGMPVLACYLKMYNFFLDPQMTPLNKSDENYLLPQRRRVFTKTLDKLIIKNSSERSMERLVWSAVAGRVEPLLSLATRTQDRIWCFAQAAVNARLERACGLENVPDVPLTVETIFAEILTQEQWPYYSLYDLMSRGAWSELVDWMSDWISESDREEKCDVHLVRMMANIVAFIRLKNFEHEHAKGEALVKVYMSRLLQLGYQELLPFYATLLPVDMSVECLMNVMPQIEGEAEQRAYMEALGTAGFDRAALITAYGKHNPEEGESAVNRVSRWQWMLLNGPETVSQTLVEATNLIRFFIANDDVDSARQVLELATHMDLLQNAHAKAEELAAGNDKKVPEVLAVALAEYKAHTLFFDAYDNCMLFSQKAIELNALDQSMGRAEEEEKDEWRSMAVVECTERALEERRRQTLRGKSKATLDIYKQRALSACELFFIDPTWRKETHDSSRSEELAILRNNCYSNVIQMIVAACNSVGDDASVLEIVAMITDEDCQIAESLSKTNLREVLERISDCIGQFDLGSTAC